jgi:hypothetical protein
MSVARPLVVGKTRACPHCKAVILESARICPKCNHHLRFDPQARKLTASRTAFRFDGKVPAPARGQAAEYCIVITVKNEKGAEVAREIVSVGALQGTEFRTMTLTVEMTTPVEG